MRSAPRDADLLNAGAAAPTGLTLASKDQHPRRVAALLAAQETKIAQGGAIGGNRSAQNGANTAKQTHRLLARNVRTARQGMDSGIPERLIHVDVAKTGDKALIQ